METITWTNLAIFFIVILATGVVIGKIMNTYSIKKKRIEREKGQEDLIHKLDLVCNLHKITELKVLKISQWPDKVIVKLHYSKSNWVCYEYKNKIWVPINLHF